MRSPQRRPRETRHAGFRSCGVGSRGGRPAYEEHPVRPSRAGGGKKSPLWGAARTLRPVDEPATTNNGAHDSSHLIVGTGDQGPRFFKGQTKTNQRDCTLPGLHEKGQPSLDALWASMGQGQHDAAGDGRPTLSAEGPNRRRRRLTRCR